MAEASALLDRVATSQAEPIETASRGELAALQLARLQSTLQLAYERVPHYRRAFDAAGVHPRDCRTLADLAIFVRQHHVDLAHESAGRHALQTRETSG